MNGKAITSADDLKLYGADQGVKAGGYAPGAAGVQTPQNEFADEIQRLAEQKNYKSLFNNQIAAYNLKVNTQKYLGNALASQGMGAQGYGTSAQVGVEGQYQNLYAQNQQNYDTQSEQNATDAATRKEAAATETDNQLATFLSYSDGSDEQVAKYMGNYGYVKGDDGLWYQKDASGAADKSKPASSYIQSAIQSAQSGSSASNPDYNAKDSTANKDNATNFVSAYKSTYANVNSDGYASVSDLGAATVGSQDGKATGALKDVVAHEISYLDARIKTGTVQNGTLFKLQRGNGMGEAYLVMYLNGKLYLCSDDDREQDQYQVSSRYGAYTGPKEEIKGK